MLYKIDRKKQGGARSNNELHAYKTKRVFKFSRLEHKMKSIAKVIIDLNVQKRILIFDFYWNRKCSMKFASLHIRVK